jgi:guanidinopropionase
VRSQSSLMRRVHHVSGTEPFSIANVADVGDLSVNPINLSTGSPASKAGMAEIVAAGAIPLSVGGDHLTTLPVLRAVAKTGLSGSSIRCPFRHQ